MGQRWKGQAVRSLGVLAAALALSASYCPSWDGSIRRGANLKCDGERGAGPDLSHTTSCTSVGEIGLRCDEQYTLQGNVNVVWVIDNSGSMTEEIKGIQENLDRFVERIQQAGVEQRTVVFSAASNNPNVAGTALGIKVNESNSVKHVDVYVYSDDGPDLLDSNYYQVAPHLQENARAHIIFVTDDNSAIPAAEFLSRINTRDLLANPTVHAVAGFNFDDCPDIAAVGSAYTHMADQTGGLKLPICCADYNAILQKLAGDIATSALSIPLSHAAAPSTIRVFLLEGGTETELTTGWSYDESRQAVVFDATARPVPGSAVRVTYSARS